MRLIIFAFNFALCLSVIVARATLRKRSTDSDIRNDSDATLSINKITGADYSICSDKYKYCTTVNQFDVILDNANCSATLEIRFLAINPENDTKLVTAFLWENGGLTNHPAGNNGHQDTQDELDEECRRTKM